MEVRNTVFQFVRLRKVLDLIWVYHVPNIYKGAVGDQTPISMLVIQVSEKAQHKHQTMVNSKAIPICDTSIFWREKSEGPLLRHVGVLLGGNNLRPNPHRMPDRTRNARRANGICWCEWGCPHCTQATSKEKCSNLCVRRIPRPVWIGPEDWIGICWH